MLDQKEAQEQFNKLKAEGLIEAVEKKQKIALDKVFSDSTGGKFNLPRITPNGHFLLERGQEYGFSTSDTRFALWILLNQKSRESQHLTKDQIEDQLWNLGEQMEPFFEDIEEFGRALDEAYLVNLEEGKKNPQKATRKRKNKKHSEQS